MRISRRNILGRPGIPADYGADVRSGSGAFQGDLTRVTTFVAANEGSNRAYPFVPDGHHDLSHHGGDPAKQAKIRQINRFHVTQFGYFTRKAEQHFRGEDATGQCDDRLRQRHRRWQRITTTTCRSCWPVAASDSNGPPRALCKETPLNNLYLSMLDCHLESSVDALGDEAVRLQPLETLRIPPRLIRRWLCSSIGGSGARRADYRFPRATAALAYLATVCTRCWLV